MKNYICECGKEFTKPNSFNAHKRSCKKHFLAKYGNTDILDKREAIRVAKIKAVALKKSAALKQEKQAQDQADLIQWLSEKHICEKCGKVMTEKFGSGRFCSIKCSNSRINTGPKLLYQCDFCHKRFQHQKSLDNHLIYCKDNPNAIKRKSHIHKLDKDLCAYRCQGTHLVNSINAVESYMQNHLNCEICGKPVELCKVSINNKVTRLCVDHDHETMQFRGALCQNCNRQLGWYEKYKQNISKYLDKPFPLTAKNNLK